VDDLQGEFVGEVFGGVDEVYSMKRLVGAVGG
jgi:hypothetical protein